MHLRTCTSKWRKFILQRNQKVSAIISTWLLFLSIISYAYFCMNTYIYTWEREWEREREREGKCRCIYVKSEMTRYPWMKIKSIKFKFSMTKQDKDLKAKRGAWEILFYECVSLYGHYWFFISLLILFINTRYNFDWNYYDWFYIKFAM